MDGFLNFWYVIGIVNFIFFVLIMIVVGCLLLYLVIVCNFEFLLLLLIGFGVILMNIFVVGLFELGGLFYYVYYIGIDFGVFLFLIFMGVGVLIDFSVLIVNLCMLLLGVVV